MAFSKIYSAQTAFLSGQIVDVEVDISKGLYNFSVVGLPDKAVEESRDRVSAAIKNSGFKSPKSKNQKVVISLAPADLKKEGPVFDLAIALGYLLASGDIKFDVEKRMFLGELSLSGNVRRVDGILPLIRRAKKNGFKEVFVPKENAAEAALEDNISIYGIRTLNEVIKHLNEKREAKRAMLAPQKKTVIEMEAERNMIDFGDIKGQESAKRGLEIAAAGKHNIILYGPPGTGKTMLARIFRYILPPLSFEEVLETTSIHSVAGRLFGNMVVSPPFRSPHHTSSYVSLVGGGTFPRPGEITLAHRGILFLDEFPEFERRVLEALREPLEERMISISRAKSSAMFPANFILVAAMNPCPCGNFGTGRECVCSPISLSRYHRKVSGPIMDRIDMWIPVGNVPYEKLVGKNASEARETVKIRSRVVNARELQKKRFSGGKRKIYTNSEMNVKDLSEFVNLSGELGGLLNAAAKKLDLSPRAYHKVIKLSRTIADLAGSDEIKKEHLLEAIQYRPKKEDFAI